MAQPVTPSAAATLVIVRDRPPSAVETLLLQRHAKSKFAAGDYVFAGGKVEADDMPADGEGFCRGLTAETAAARLGGDLSPREALSYWVGAIREAAGEGAHAGRHLDRRSQVADPRRGLRGPHEKRDRPPDPYHQESRAGPAGWRARRARARPARRTGGADHPPANSPGGWQACP